MAAKPVISVKCPCCKSILEVDTEKRRVLAHRKGRHLSDDAGEGEDGMDVAVRNHMETKAKIDDKFAAATDGMKNQSARLDELFDEAAKKAKDMKDEDDDPSNPFGGGRKIWD